MNATTIEVINLETFNQQYGDKVGSILFPNDWYDCFHYVDNVKLRKNIKNQLPKGARILKVMVPTTNSSRYMNIVNPQVPYKTPVCADIDQDGAYFYHSNHGFGMWASNYPVGDAIVVINK